MSLPDRMREVSEMTTKSEKVCVQTVNVFGYPLSGRRCTGGMWHEQPNPPTDDCDEGDKRRTCRHHEPLYAAPPTDEKCMQLVHDGAETTFCGQPQSAGVHTQSFGIPAACHEFVPPSTPEPTREEPSVRFRRSYDQETGEVLWHPVAPQSPAGEQVGASEAVVALDQILRDCDLQVRIGLRAQGHMPAVEKMLRDGKTWDDIGAAIGWHGPSVREWWSREVLADLAELSRLRSLVSKRGLNKLNAALAYTVTNEVGFCCHGPNACETQFRHCDRILTEHFEEKK